MSLEWLYGFDELNVYRLDTKKATNGLRPRQAQNKPLCGIGAGGPVTTLLPRLSLGEEYRYEDHDPSPFCVVNANPRREAFQLARALWKKRGPTICFL